MRNKQTHIGMQENICYSAAFTILSLSLTEWAKNAPAYPNHQAHKQVAIIQNCLANSLLFSSLLTITDRSI